MVFLSLTDHLFNFRNQGWRLSLRFGRLQGHLAPGDVAPQHVGGPRHAGDGQQVVAGQAGISLEFDSGVVVTQNA